MPECKYIAYRLTSKPSVYVLILQPCETLRLDAFSSKLDQILCGGDELQTNSIETELQLCYSAGSDLTGDRRKNQIRY